MVAEARWFRMAITHGPVMKPGRWHRRTADTMRPHIRFGLCGFYGGRGVWEYSDDPPQAERCKRCEKREAAA